MVNLRHLDFFIPKEKGEHHFLWLSMEEKGKVPIIDHLQGVRHYPRSCALRHLILTSTLCGRYYQLHFIGEDTQRPSDPP